MRDGLRRPAAQSFSAATYNIRQLNARTHGRGQRLGAASPGDLVADPFPRLRHLRARRSSTASCRALRGAARLRLRRRRTRRRGRGRRILRDLLQAQPLPTARFGPFLALRRPLEARQGLGRQIRPHLHMGPVLSTDEPSAVLVLHHPHRPPRRTGSGRAAAWYWRRSKSCAAASGSSSRATSTWARRAGAMRSCATPASCPTPTTRPKSAMPKQAPKTGSTPTSRPSAASTTSS